MLRLCWWLRFLRASSCVTCLKLFCWCVLLVFVLQLQHDAAAPKVWRLVHKGPGAATLPKMAQVGGWVAGSAACTP